MQSAAAAIEIERVFEFLEKEELEDETEKAEILDGVKGEVEFSHIHFAYPTDLDKEIIHDFSIHVSSGQKVAIVGHTGTDKTTLVNLTSGVIKIVGVDITDVFKRKR